MKIIIYFDNYDLERFILHYLKQLSNIFIIKYKNERDFLLKPDRAIIVRTKMNKTCTFTEKCRKMNLFLGSITYINDNSVLSYKVNEKSDFHSIIPLFIKDLIAKNKTTKSFRSPLKNYDPKNKKVNIYLPTYYRLEKTIKSVESIISLSEKSKFEMKVFIGDNNTKIEEMIKWLGSLKNVKVYFSDKNIGKASMVNKLHNLYGNNNPDYVFSIDSDMYSYTDDYNVLDEMINILDKCDNIGLVSSNQKECCHHWFGKTVFSKLKNGYNLGYTNNGIGIAGGCIVMKTSDWERIGGYKENHDIYTGDDSILTYNIERKLCKDPVVAMDYYMMHPAASDVEEKKYQEWKNKSWIRDNTKFIDDNYNGSNVKGYYD